MLVYFLFKNVNPIITYKYIDIMKVELIKPALLGALGTTGMTLFSILTSEKKNQQFREHEILSLLMKPLPISKTNRVALGLIGHYLTGMGFNTVNQAFLKRIKKKPTFLNGLLLGAANGVVGIAIWSVIFKLHPNPPDINLRRYLGHLMLAHLVFGASSNLTMKGVSKNTSHAFI